MRSPASSCGPPGTRRDAGNVWSPIWPCSGWGLHCPGCCHPGGGLLPRHFTLTPKGGIFSVALSLTGEPATGRYPAPCPAEPGLSSHAFERLCDRPARSNNKPQNRLKIHVQINKQGFLNFIEIMRRYFSKWFQKTFFIYCSYLITLRFGKF